MQTAFRIQKEYHAPGAFSHFPFLWSNHILPKDIMIATIITWYFLTLPHKRLPLPAAIYLPAYPRKFWLPVRLWCFRRKRVVTNYHSISCSMTGQWVRRTRHAAIVTTSIVCLIFPLFLWPPASLTILSCLTDIIWVTVYCFTILRV